MQSTTLRSLVGAGLTALTLVGTAACKNDGGTDTPNTPGDVPGGPGVPGDMNNEPGAPGGEGVPMPGGMGNAPGNNNPGS